MFEKKLRYPFKKGMPKGIVSSPLFLLRYSQNNLTHSGFAVVVSKKVDKLATKRNKIKRRVVATIKSIFGKNLPFDFVFIIRKEITESDVSAIKREMEKAFNKIKII